jgi:hypothetical protein
MTTYLQLTVEEVAGDPTPLVLEMGSLANFGYAGRDQAAVAAHVAELSHLGLPAPGVTPCIFQLPPERATTASTLVAVGAATYGEAEFALVRAGGQWYVCAASDHSDLEVERVSTARSKAMYQDVLSQRCWRLVDVAPHWDQIELTCIRATPDGEQVVQSGRLGELLAPADLIAEYQRRLGAPVADGSVVLSGTIAGEPCPGGSRWSVELRDPKLGRSLGVSYEVHELAEELR